MKKIIFLIIFILLTRTADIFGQIGAREKTSSNSSIYGIINDENGRKIKNAEIILKKSITIEEIIEEITRRRADLMRARKTGKAEISKKKKYIFKGNTDQNGEYIFKDLKAGNYVIYVRDNAQSGKMCIISNNYIQGNIRKVIGMPSSLKIKGTVSDNKNNWVENEQINIFYSEYKEEYKIPFYNNITTDKNGEFTLKLPKGVYIITFTRENKIDGYLKLKLDNDTEVAYVLPPKINFVGQILSNDSDIKVSLKNDIENKYIELEKQNIFKFENILAGNYIISFRNNRPKYKKIKEVKLKLYNDTKITFYYEKE